jgi:hypothetical protein
MSHKHGPTRDKPTRHGAEQASLSPLPALSVTSTTPAALHAYCEGCNDDSHI